MDNLISTSDNLTAFNEDGSEQQVGRRRLLRLGGGAALAAGAAALVRPTVADANSGDPWAPAPTIDARQAGTGDGIYAHIENVANGNRAVFGRTVGVGIAVVASVANEKSAASAAKGTTVGSGPGVEGQSAQGVGGKFAGKAAQLQLVPSTAIAPPAAGTAGQLFVDRANRLWFCQGSAGWKQLA